MRVALGSTVLAVACWVMALPSIHIQRVGATGFIDALRPLYFVGAAALAVGFVASLSTIHPPRWLLVAQLVVLLLMLYGTVAIVEPLPRFATSWLHAGFTDYIMRTGKTAPSYDARFNWPGFFGAAALLSKAAGLSSPLVLLRWAPVVFNALFAVGVFAIASAVTRVERARWLATWLFLTCNWVGQDYFSPQALGYLLALCCALLLLRWLVSTPLVTAGGVHTRRARWALLLMRAPDELTADPPEASQVALAVTLMFLIFGALVVTHQLTPPVVIVWAAVLVVARRCRVRALPFALASIFLLWLSYGTIAYWSGHLKDLFGGFGHLGSAVNQNLTSRVSGSGSRIVVQHLRLAFTAAIALLAGLGMVRRIRSGFGDLSVGLLAMAPFSVLLVQSYGGEALLRSLFLALPFFAVLGASAFFPRPGHPGIGRALVLTIVLVIAVPTFFVARYGNEAWDMTSPGDYAAFQYVYNHAPRGSTLISVASEVPWGYRDLLGYKLVENATLSDPIVAELELHSSDPKPAYLIVTRDQVNFGRLFTGEPPDWAATMEEAVLATGSYRIVYSNPDAQVITRSLRP